MASEVRASSGTVVVGMADRLGESRTSSNLALMNARVTDSLHDRSVPVDSTRYRSVLWMVTLESESPSNSDSIANSMGQMKKK